MGAAADGTSIMVIRVWMEDHADSPFRARILVVGDTGPSEPQEAVVGSPAEVLETVGAWLAGVTRAAGPPV